MDSNHISYYQLAIHPSKINVYYQAIPGFRRRYIDPDEKETTNNTTIKQPTQFKDNYHQGRMSKIATRKLTRSLDYLVHMAKPKKIVKPYHGRNFTFKVNFITLTLSSKQIHSDQVIKAELLNHFLITSLRKWNVTKYVWRAEKQENGNIHFHIATGNFIPWNELRNEWNKIQQKLGYVTRYRENREEWHKKGFNYDPRHAKQWPYERQLKAWKKGCETQWDNPNSVDIHSLMHVGNIKAYMVKYMSKNKKYTDEEIQAWNELSEEEKEMIRNKTAVTGRLWSCSVNLSGLKGGETEVDSIISEELQRLVDHDGRLLYNSDYFHVFTVDIALLIKLNCVTLLNCFEDYIRKRFPDDYLAVIR